MSTIDQPQCHWPVVVMLASAAGGMVGEIPLQEFLAGT